MPDVSRLTLRQYEFREAVKSRIPHSGYKVFVFEIQGLLRNARRFAIKITAALCATILAFYF